MHTYMHLLFPLPCLDPLPFGCNGDALHVCMICLPFYLDLLVTIYIYIYKLWMMCLSLSEYTFMLVCVFPAVVMLLLFGLDPVARLFSSPSDVWILAIWNLSGMPF